MDQRFYLLMECPICDSDIHYGPVLDLTPDHQGLPVISFDIASQTNFECDRCGANNYTDDLMEHVVSEDGDDPDELEDEAEDGDFDDTEVSA